MPAINPKSLKIAMILMGIAVLLLFPAILLDNPRYRNWSNSISIIQCFIYLYNYWYFRKFLSEILDYHKMTVIIILFTMAIIVSGLGYFFNLIGQEESDWVYLLYLLFLILAFSYLPYAIKLYRVESDVYQYALRFIATSALIILFYFICSATIATRGYYEMDEYSIVWTDFVTGLEDLAFIYLYWKAKKEMESGNYVSPEERFKIGE